VPLPVVPLPDVLLPDVPAPPPDVPAPLPEVPAPDVPVLLPLVPLLEPAVVASSALEPLRLEPPVAPVREPLVPVPAPVPLVPVPAPLAPVPVVPLPLAPVPLVLLPVPDIVPEVLLPEAPVPEVRPDEPVPVPPVVVPPVPPDDPVPDWLSHPTRFSPARASEADAKRIAVLRMRITILRCGSWGESMGCPRFPFPFAARRCVRLGGAPSRHPRRVRRPARKSSATGMGFRKGGGCNCEFVATTPTGRECHAAAAALAAWTIQRRTPVV